MLQGQVVRCLFLFITIFKYVYNFEVFVSKTKDENIQQLTNYRDKSYEIPLYQTHYLTLRIHSNDFQRIKSSKNNEIGFKFQVKSTDAEIVNLRKEIMMPIHDKSYTVLLEDLYILPRKKVPGGILNAYPSPTLIRTDKNSINDLQIWSIEGVKMGVTHLTIRLDVFYEDETSISHIWSLDIRVKQPRRFVDIGFYLTVPFIFAFISLLMGISLDRTIIGSMFKKPKLVLVGFVSQYVLMPFVAIAIAKIFRYTPLNSLALFIIGCSPGCSNLTQMTVLFDGDVNLSGLMAFISMITSIIMMPLYFYTIGKHYMNDIPISIPYWHFARALALVVIPYIIGVIISHFSPKSRPIGEKLIKPVVGFFMLFFIIFALVFNWHLFKTIDLLTAFTTPVMSYSGFLLGGLLAWISRMDWKQIKTVGIETGLRNTVVAFSIVMYALPQPYGTEVILLPMFVTFFATRPISVIIMIRNRIMKKKQQKESNVDGKLVISNDKQLSNNGEIENRQQL